MAEFEDSHADSCPEECGRISKNDAEEWDGDCPDCHNCMVTNDVLLLLHILE